MSPTRRVVRFPHPHRRRRDGRPPDAGAVGGRGAARPAGRASSRCWWVRCAASRRRLLPHAQLPLSPAAGRADLPPAVVEERALALRRASACCAGCARCSARSIPWPCSAPAATRARRWSGGRAASAFPPPIQEQNAYPGLANRWLAKRVQEIYLGLPEAMAHFDKGTDRPRDRHRQPDRAAHPGACRARPAALRARAGRAACVLITGGSQGALAINRAVAEWMGHGVAAATSTSSGSPGRARTSSSSTSMSRRTCR